MDSEYSLKNGIFADLLVKTFFISLLVITMLLFGVLYFGIMPEARAGFLTGRIIKIDDEDKVIVISVFCLLSAVFIIMCFFRIKTLRYYFQDGIETDAEISDSIYDNKSSFVYIYRINNKEYRLIKDITDMEKSLDYKKGDIVKVLVDPQNHENSILKDNYINRKNI